MACSNQWMDIMSVYIRIIILLTSGVLMPTEGRLIQTSLNKGCVAQSSSGVIDLHSLARNDSLPRFITTYMGMNFSFNPCVPFGDQDIINTHKPLLDLRFSSPSSSKSSHIVLGTLKSASFKTPKQILCYVKSSDIINSSCPISEIIGTQIYQNVQSEGIHDDKGTNVKRSVDLNMTDDDDSSSVDDLADDDDEVRPSPSSQTGHMGEMTEYPANVTAVIRLGSKGVCQQYKMMVLLQCVPHLLTHQQATFQLIHTCTDKLYFMLSHRCCCEGLCDPPATDATNDVMTTRIAPDLPILSSKYIPTDLPPSKLHPIIPAKIETIDNGTLIELESPVHLEETPKFMWLILVVNVGVLAAAIIIAGMCCRKGGSSTALYTGGPYNYLPAMNSSRLTMADSMESVVHHQIPPKAAEYLDYSSARVKSSQVPQLVNCVIQSRDVDLGKRLGGGVFGDTYIAGWKDRTVAAKRITVGVHQTQLTDDHYTWLVDEVTHLSKQRHKHLAAVIGVVTDTRQPYVLTEYIEGEALKDLITRDPEAFNWTHKIKICIQVAEGLTYLHSSRTPVLHRDLRCANIIIDKYERAKLVDFGMTKLMQKLRQVCNGRKGCYCKKELSALPASVRWTAPEVLEHPQADEQSDIIRPACDVYSYAMVMWELASHCDPYEDVPDENEVMELVLSGVRPRIDILVGTVPHVRELMVLCWDHNPDNRPTTKQMVYQLKICLQVINKKSSKGRSRANSSSNKGRSRANSSTHYLKSALNVSVD